MSRPAGRRPGATVGTLNPRGNAPRAVVTAAGGGEQPQPSQRPCV